MEAGDGDGERARTLLELAEAVDEGGDEAIRRIAAAAGTEPAAVHAWHLAWRAAWKGPVEPTQAG